MNSKQLHNIFLSYPASICIADQLIVQRGRFVISNKDTSQGPYEHWVTFYFPKCGPFEFFQLLEHMPEDYAVEFEKVLSKNYLKNVLQLQQSTSNVCGLHCRYYMMKQHAGKTMKCNVNYLNLHRKKRNDPLIVA